MLSVCIPVFNHHIKSLVDELHEQGSQLGVPFEILIIDDASNPDCQQKNRSLSQLKLVRYEELKHNIGRSKIRNLLAMKARYPLLLFLDCDLEVISHGFLKNYLDAGKDGSVVCGGHIYQSEKPPHPFILHWLAGSRREAAPAAQRQRHPYLSFMTASFLVPSSLLYQLPFNEELTGYGHEDTLYGYQLMKQRTPIKHIDNPVIHEGLEPGDVFLRKTREGLGNLNKIGTLTKNDPEFIDMVRVLKVCHKLKRLKTHKPLDWFFKIFERTLAKHLTGKHPRLWMLDVYKLGTICQNI